jgi:hypothetical protein
VQAIDFETYRPRLFAIAYRMLGWAAWRGAASRWPSTPTLASRP